MREERARAKADTELSDAARAEQLKRLDGIATILAKTAARDTSLIALLESEAPPTATAQKLRRDWLLESGTELSPDDLIITTERPVAEAGQRHPAGARREAGHPAVGEGAPALQPVPRARLLAGCRRGADARAAASTRGSCSVRCSSRSSTARAARRPAWTSRRRRAIDRYSPPGLELMHHQARFVESVRLGHRSLPARRRARPRQDGAVRARRLRRRRLPAARRRAERRQDELGARGGALDAAPPRHRHPRRRRGAGRVRRRRHRQLRGARPAPRLAEHARLQGHGRRRGALHQEPALAALQVRARARRGHPRDARRRPADDRAHRNAADQRHRRLPGDLAVPRLDRRQQADAAADGEARGDRAHPGRLRLLRRRARGGHRHGHRAPPQDRRRRRPAEPPRGRPAGRARRRPGPLDPPGREGARRAPGRQVPARVRRRPPRLVRRRRRGAPHAPHPPGRPVGARGVEVGEDRRERLHDGAQDRPGEGRARLATTPPSWRARSARSCSSPSTST